MHIENYILILTRRNIMNKLDFETRLFLFFTGATIVREKKYTAEETNHNIVYIFDSYDDFNDYFLKYLEEDEINEYLIEEAIYTISKRGAIVAFKGLCDHIITKTKTNRELKSNIRELSEEEINNIHSKGKLTPLEIVKKWESFDICAPGDAIGSVAFRCSYFNNCHDCLMHYAFNQLEHEPIDLVLCNSISDKTK